DARRGSGRVMVVRFWGTRGSIPVAMTAAQVQRKLVAALTRAAGRPLDTPQKIREFVERELDFPVSHTFGGNSSCVQIDGGGREYLLCDLGGGVRGFGNHGQAAAGSSGHTFNLLMSHPHWGHVRAFAFLMTA